MGTGILVGLDSEWVRELTALFPEVTIHQIVSLTHHCFISKMMRDLSFAKSVGVLSLCW